MNMNEEFIKQLSEWIARAVSAEHERAALQAEATRLRAELDVTRDLLQTTPAPDYRSEYEQWRGYVDDYLETI